MRILLIIIGTFSVAAGVVGILLPLVPTTPFLLLAAWCFARSSERFYSLLVNNRWLGPYIRNYRDGRGMTLRAKVSTLSVLWIAMIIGAGFVVPILWARLLLVGIGVGVTVFLLSLPTCELSEGVDDQVS